MKPIYSILSMGILAFSVAAQAATIEVKGDTAKNLFEALKAVPRITGSSKVTAQDLTCEGGYLIMARRSLTPTCSLHQEVAYTRSGDTTHLERREAEGTAASNLMTALHKAGVKPIGVEITTTSVESIDCTSENCTLEVR